MKVNSTNHCFLKHSSGFILDITKHQFKSKLDYSKGIGKGFLTKDPSKRTRILLKKIAESKTWSNLKNKTPLTAIFYDLNSYRRRAPMAVARQFSI
jgi:hypothetical protein